MNLEFLKYRYLKNSSWLKPIFPILIAIGIYSGYKSTERIWANLAYINDSDGFAQRYKDFHFEAINEIDFTQEEEELLDDSLKKSSMDWPISLLTNLVFDTLTNKGQILLPDKSKIIYDYNDKLFLDSATKRIRRKFTMDIQNNSFPMLEQLIAQRIDSNSEKYLAYDELATLYIEYWNNTDTIQVRFYKNETLEE